MITPLRFSRVFSLAVLLAALIFVSACQGQRIYKETQEVANPNSSLLPVMLQRSEVAGDWKWIWDDLRQTNDTPTSQNHNQVEHATRSLTGDYGTEPYYVTLSHRLVRYTADSPSPQDLQQMLQEIAKDEGNAHTFSPNLESNGLPMASRCFDDGAVEDCWVAVQYNHLVSWMILRTVPSFKDKLTAEDILNQILTAMDGRIREIDK